MCDFHVLIYNSSVYKTAGATLEQTQDCGRRAKSRAASFLPEKSSDNAGSSLSWEHNNLMPSGEQTCGEFWLRCENYSYCTSGEQNVHSG